MTTQPDLMARAQVRLAEIRARKDLAVKKTAHLKDTFTGFDGKEHPLVLRYYQIQGMLHLVVMRRFILGDDTGLGKCVVADTMLRTDNGFRSIGSLAPKPLSELSVGSFHPLAEPVRVRLDGRWMPVRRFYYDGTRATKKITTRSGLTLEGSFRHPVKARRADGTEDFIRLPDLRLGDALCVSRDPGAWPETEPDILVRRDWESNAKEYRLPTKLTPELSRLLGWVVAEGHSADKYEMDVSQHDADGHADIRSLFKSVFNWEGDIGNKNRAKLVSVSSVQIVSFLEQCGVAPVLSAEKRVPGIVLHGTRESVREFLRGLFEGDGHAIPGSGIEYTSKSERLVREVQQLLLGFGIVSVRKPKKIKGNPHTYWRLTIFGDDARLFAKMIGFVTERKNAALRALLDKPSNPNRDVVPFARDLVEDLRRDIYAKAGLLGHKGKGIVKRWGRSFFSTLENVRHRRRNPSMRFLERMVSIAEEVGVEGSALDAVRAVVSRKFFYDPVMSIEDGFAEVMDIEVDDPAHAFEAGGFVNHNTLEAIAALCYIWEKEPNRKAIVLTTKSAARQWVGEFKKFTTGVRAIVGAGTPAQRKAAREAFVKSQGPTVLVMGYRSAVQDFTHLQHIKGHILVADEATAFKNIKTQVHQVVAHLSTNADRAWGLTATLIKNNLMEGYGIYQALVPGLFQMTPNQFMLYYCIVRMQQLPRSRRQIPVIVGYAAPKVAEFRQVVDPYFIGRPKHEVASELPSLVAKTVEVDMTALQEEKYADALAGLLEVGTGADAVVKETTKLSAIAYCQEIVDDLALIDVESPESPKLDTLVDLLTEGDLDGEKVIVFSRFRKMVDVIMARLAKEGIKAVRITGAENEVAREKAKEAFQSPSSDVRVVCITAAGSEAVNLQAAKAVICYDSPWSAGDFIQLVGRMIRIGSVHDKCFVVHLLARGRKGKTVDHRVMEVLGKKLALIEAVLGKRFKGEGELATVDAENDISDLFAALQQDAREAKSA